MHYHMFTLHQCSIWTRRHTYLTASGYIMCSTKYGGMTYDGTTNIVLVCNKIATTKQRRAQPTQLHFCIHGAAARHVTHAAVAGPGANVLAYINKPIAIRARPRRRRSGGATAAVARLKDTAPPFPDGIFCCLV